MSELKNVIITLSLPADIAAKLAKASRANKRTIQEEIRQQLTGREAQILNLKNYLELSYPKDSYLPTLLKTL